MPTIIRDLNELRRRVGQELGVSDWFSVPQAMINSFADVTGDQQWIHVDVARSRAESPYGEPIAHGFLTLSLLTQMYRQAVELNEPCSRSINYGFDRVRFPSAVRSGARIRGRFVLAGIDEVEGGFEIKWKVTVDVENQSKPALVAEWIGRVYR